MHIIILSKNPFFLKKNSEFLRNLVFTASDVAFAGFLFVDDTDLIAFAESHCNSSPLVQARGPSKHGMVACVLRVEP
jgi:hypothetical protein